MQIPQSYLSILDRNIRLVSHDSSIKPFIDKCFADLFDLHPNLPFQTRAKISGDIFEFMIFYLLDRVYHIRLDDSIPIRRACMLGEGALDFGLYGRDSVLLCGIEVKGSAATVDGKQMTRPALKRTDTMKKAISQAYQFKRIYPSTPFYIVTNVKPTQGNAKCMMELAEGDIIDRVFDVTNPKELQELVSALRRIRPHS